MSREMNYMQFQACMTEKLEGALPECYRVEVHPVVKNNNLRFDSLVILAEETCVSPQFYLQQYYQRYLTGEAPEMFIREMLMVYQRAQQEQGKYRQSLSLSACRANIIYRLVSYEKNRPLFQTAPHIPFLDMAITFRCLLLEEEDEIGSITVSNALQREWGMTTKELFQIAQENTMRLFPKRICRMEELLCSMLQESEGAGQEILRGFIEEKQGSEFMEIFVVTNQKGINGATAMLYPGCLGELEALCQGDYFILPSSIHEVLAVPASQHFSVQDLESMVRDVNHHCVQADEFLSDHVYRYSKEGKTLEIAGIEESCIIDG